MEDAEIEIEAVRSIWPDVLVDRSIPGHLIVKHKIKSMENEETSASVRIEVKISARYPSEAPIAAVSNPRGIDDKDFDELQTKIDELIRNNRDEMPIICELFQMCCDFLTERQHTSDLACLICLRDLAQLPITVTPCDHFLHSKCFIKYLSHVEIDKKRELDECEKNFRAILDQTVYCPVCRYSLTGGRDFRSEIRELVHDAKKNQKTLKKATAEVESPLDLKKWREEQKRLQAIFERQKERGGIIDEEAERKRYFYIDTTNNSGNSRRL
ncbi:unnamed protein product [Caenorhabditis bovis]|uniref:RWD domain-containing protein n=1 Tax=Caenorhabditis bovis TaxID=2654633 RepID=A0A8S1EQM4_9PELO|nr:unnamed protein product [Caenorhabditis bovis]